MPTADTPTADTPIAEGPVVTSSGSVDSTMASPTSSVLDEGTTRQFGGGKGYSLFTVTSLSALKEGLSSGAESLLRDSLTQGQWESVSVVEYM